MIAVGTEPVLSNQGVAVGILVRVDRASGDTVGHGLIAVLLELEDILALVPMHTLDDLGSDQRAAGDNTLDRDHAVEVLRRQRPWVASVEAEAACPGAVVENIVAGLVRSCLRDGLDDLFEGLVEGEGEIEGVVEQPVGDF